MPHLLLPTMSTLERYGENAEVPPEITKLLRKPLGNPEKDLLILAKCPDTNHRTVQKSPSTQLRITSRFIAKQKSV